MTLYPSILCSNPEEALNEAKIVAELGGPLQWDVVDGQFADNYTLEPQDIDSSVFGERSVDIHLMVVDPSQWLSSYAGLPFVRTVIAQVERLPDPDEFLFVAHEYGMRAGFSFDLHTPIDEFPKKILTQADLIQCMGVEAGHQGQPFQNIVLEKVRGLRSIFPPESNVEIVVDGGVKIELLESLAKAGATGVVVGSAIWNAKSPRDALREFQRAVAGWNP